MRFQLGLALQALLLVAAGCDGFMGTQAATPSQRSKPEGGKSMSNVRVRVIGADGKLSEPREMPMLVLSDAEWHKRLTPQQFRITRGKDTERPFCGTLLHNKKAGMYVCVCCNLPLFESAGKFDSGTGWPSFFQPVAKENVREVADHSHGVSRTEILCQRCGAHLGHVFNDGPPPTGLRYCLNSESLRFVASDQLKTIAEPAPSATGSLRRRRRIARRARRGGLRRGLLLVRRSRLSPTPRRARRDQRLCRRRRRHGQL